VNYGVDYGPDRGEFTEVFASEIHSFVKFKTSDERCLILGFGLNSSCQLGVETIVPTTSPVILEFPGQDVWGIAGGRDHTIFLVEGIFLLLTYV
jgi:hypothetical protein